MQPSELVVRPAAQERFQSRTLLRILGSIASILLLAAGFRGIDLGDSVGAVEHLGWGVTWALVPSVMSLILEITAWRIACVQIDSRVTYLGLLRVRIATEWLSNAVPLGALWAEGLKPAFLSRATGVPIPAGVTALLARKYLLIASQGAYVLAGAICIFPLIRTRFGSVHWAVAVAALGSVAVLLFALGESTRLLLGRGAAMTWLATTLSRLPSRRMRNALQRLAAVASEADEQTVRFFRAPRKELFVPLAFCLAGWLLEATETWLILGLLGASTSWPQALGVEAFVVLIRHVLVFLPGGLGAQELGYAALLSSSGGWPICASFSIVKRLRELFWAALGASLLVTDRAGARKARSLRVDGSRTTLRAHLADNRTIQS